MERAAFADCGIRDPGIDAGHHHLLDQPFGISVVGRWIALARGKPLHCRALRRGACAAPFAANWAFAPPARRSAFIGPMGLPAAIAAVRLQWLARRAFPLCLGQYQYLD